MKTKVIMKRKENLNEISQDSKTGYFNGNEIISWINYYRINKGYSVKQLNEYWRLDQTSEFLKALSKETGINIEELKKVKRGKEKGTWIHPYIAIDLTMWGHPELKVKVIKWIHDNLIKFREDSGDSFKEMNIALDMAFNIGGRYWIYTKVADKIAKACGVGYSKDRWQKATEEQLELRDEIQKVMSYILYMANTNTPEETVDKAIDTIINS